MEFINLLFESINQIKSQNLIGISGVLSACIQVYRMIPGAPWPSAKYNWVIGLCLGLIGFLIAILTGVFGFGLGWPAALSAGLGVAINAMGFGAGMKTIGQAIFSDPVDPAVVAAQEAKNKPLRMSIRAKSELFNDKTNGGV